MTTYTDRQKACIDRPATQHVVKCWPEQFALLRAGVKRFEYRKNDRDYRAGDTLKVCEYDPNDDRFSGQTETFYVPHVLDAGFGMPEGYCVLSLESTSPITGFSEPDGGADVRGEPTNAGLPTLPKAMWTCGGIGLFTEHQMQGYANAALAAPSQPAAPAVDVAVAQGEAVIEKICALIQKNPPDELGPTDEPESQYRFGYNTALEDALSAVEKSITAFSEPAGAGDVRIPDAKRDELISALLASLEKSDQRETDFYLVRSFIGDLGLAGACRFCGTTTNRRDCKGLNCCKDRQYAEAPQSTDGGAGDARGWKLAMRVLQSDLYGQLDDGERAECDALVRANPYIAAPSQPAAPADRVEQLRKALFEARDAMRVMSKWVKKSDRAGYSWGVRMVDRANAVLNGEEACNAPLTRLDAPSTAAPAVDVAAEDAYVIKRLSGVLAQLAGIILGDESDMPAADMLDKLPEAAQVLKLELDLYRSTAAASKPTASAALHCINCGLAGDPKCGCGKWRHVANAAPSTAAQGATDAKAHTMACDLQAEQTFLGSCYESCDDSGKARWKRLQRVIDHLTAPTPVADSGASVVPDDLLPNALWTRRGSGTCEWWSFKGYEAKKDGADQWVLRKAGTELYRHTYLQVVMAHAERAILAAAKPVSVDAVPDAAISACALMIKGICMTHPQDAWTAKIKERICYMLGTPPTESTGSTGEPTL